MSTKIMRKVLSGVLSLSLIMTLMPTTNVKAESDSGKANGIDAFIEALNGGDDNKRVEKLYDEGTNTYILKLLQDIELTNSLCLRTDSEKVVLDFDGHFITVSSPGESKYNYLILEAYETITLIDSGGIKFRGETSAYLRGNVNILKDTTSPHKAVGDHVTNVPKGIPIVEEDAKVTGVYIDRIDEEDAPASNSYIEDLYAYGELQSPIRVVGGNAIIDNIHIESIGIGGLEAALEAENDSLIINGADVRCYPTNEELIYAGYGINIGINADEKYFGNVVINGGSFKGKLYGVYAANAVAEINGGSFNGGEFGLCNIESTLNISGGTFYGGIEGIDVEGGTVNVYGGSFSGVDDGAALWYGDMNIYDGTFTGTNESGIFAIGEGQLNIYDGSFSTEVEGAAVIAYNTDINIAGGSFNSVTGLVSYDFDEGVDPVDYGWEERVTTLISITGGDFTGSDEALSLNNTNVTISGGSFTGETTNGAYISGSDVRIKGGTFSGPESGKDIKIIGDDSHSVFFLKDDEGSNAVTVGSVAIDDPDQLKVLQVNNSLKDIWDFTANTEGTFTEVEDTDFSVWDNTGAEFMEEIGQSYTVTYHLDDGVNAIANPSRVFENMSYVLLDAQKAGYKFKGWYTESTFENKIESIDSPTKNMDLYAKFEHSAPVKHQVAEFSRNIEGYYCEDSFAYDFEITDGNKDKSTYTYDVIGRYGNNNPDVVSVDENGVVKPTGVIGKQYIGVRVPSVDGYYAEDYTIAFEVKKTQPTISVSENVPAFITKSTENVKVSATVVPEFEGEEIGDIVYESLTPDILSVDALGNVSIASSPGKGKIKLSVAETDQMNAVEKTIDIDVYDDSVTAPEIEVDVDENEVKLVWEDVFRISGPGTKNDDSWELKGYHVYKSSDGTNYEKLDTVTKTNYTDRIEEGTYYYKVKAFDTVGEGAYSNTVKASYLAQPATPVVTPVADGMQISWEGNPLAEKYIVYRYNDDTVLQLATVTDITYVDVTSKTNGTKYVYSVKAVNSEAESLASQKAEAYYLTKVSISKVSILYNGYTVEWSKNKKATGYVLYRSKDGGEYEKVKTITKNTTLKYTDKKATTNGAKYTYRVVPMLEDGTVKWEGVKSSGKTSYFVSRPNFSSAKNVSSKKITFKWKKNSMATGYQIKYVLGTQTKTVTITKNSAVSKTISKLKKGKTYKCYIRSYKTVSGKKYYSVWSGAKSIKIKK